MSFNNYTIYQHKNKINNKSYIGLTCQIPEKRWGKQGENYKHNPKFWAAIQKYGWDNFEHIILETNLTKEQAENREQYYINFFNSYKNGYNSSLGGESGFNGGHHTEETKQKISENMQNYIIAKDPDRGLKLRQMLKDHPEIEQKRIENVKKAIPPAGSQAAKDRVAKNKKPILCIELNKKFSSIQEAAKIMNISNSSISHCLRGDQKTAGGYHWQYLSED